MPDIRLLLSHLSPEDKQLWSQHRTEMRRSYITAHNSILGVSAWCDYDDAFLDLIDTKLALLFDAAGKANVAQLVANDDANRIEADIAAAIGNMKEEPVNMSAATASVQSKWQGSQPSWPKNNGAG